MLNGQKGFASPGVKVGGVKRSIREQRLASLKGNSVTMGRNIPHNTEGKVGDITVRDVTGIGLVAYIKTNSGWYDINSLSIENRFIWIPMVLQNSWATDTDYGEPQYIKDSNGFVHFKGGVDTGSHTAVITTLPVGFRPLFEQRRLVSPALTSNLIIQQIRITTGGAVSKPYGSQINTDDSVDLYNTANICLDGISFFAGQTIIGSGGGTSSSGGSGGAGGGL